jgi:hypothetical protein
MKTLAWKFQNVGRSWEVAPTFTGRKGAGKSTLGVLIERIEGVYCLTLPNLDNVTRRFNKHLGLTSTVFVDDADWRGGDVGKFQSMIKAKRLFVEPKGIDPFQTENNLSLIICVERGKCAVPAGEDERRYPIFEVSEARIGDGEYFGELYAEINGSGPAALLEELLDMDLDNFHPRQIPR